VGSILENSEPTMDFNHKIGKSMNALPNALRLLKLSIQDHPISTLNMKRLSSVLKLTHETSYNAATSDLIRTTKYNVANRYCDISPDHAPSGWCLAIAFCIFPPLPMLAPFSYVSWGRPVIRQCLTAQLDFMLTLCPEIVKSSQY
jgi:hypothetical protein